MSRSLWKLLSIIAFYAPAMCAATGGAATVEDVRAAWKAREERVNTAYFEWQEVRTHPAKTLIKVNPVDLAESPERFPAEDTEVALEMSLRLMGPDLFKYSRQGKSWSLEMGKFLDQEYITAFDGKLSKSFFGTVKDLADVPIGFINQNQCDYDNRHLKPPLLCFRPFHDGVGVTLDNATIAPGEVALGDARCVIMRCEGRSPRLNQEYWLDAGRNYIALRLRESRGAKTIRQFDVSYSKHSDGEWTPTEWTILEMMKDGSLQEENRAKVLTTLINSGVNVSDFQFDFPVGTKVIDRGTTGAPAQVFIAMTGGRRREVSQEELAAGIGYDVLSTTDRPTIGASHSYRWILILVNVIVLICVAGMLLWKRLYKT